MNTYLNGGVYEYRNENTYWYNNLLLYVDGYWYAFGNPVQLLAGNEDTETTINEAWIGKLVYRMNYEERS
jgi:hypothetical protein